MLLILLKNVGPSAAKLSNLSPGCLRFGILWRAIFCYLLSFIKYIIIVVNMHELLFLKPRLFVLKVQIIIKINQFI